ncbi:hypothetical protein PNP85_13430 [Halobacterium salinarum]|uniref:hypothetical protein n=1 Tax=Halobacterium salinarum TaxID=2242 RepID=UPI002554FEED|nr:hypothetical protein [Halobacterium salinarum]MDL0137308.1 hypothetical protein [Halobacterium salinarum]MDL0140505.1 hypothetical protein [Halobacterium salinarum]
MDDLVVPEETPDGETVYCPACSGRMRLRGAGDQQARHFMHIENLTDTTSSSDCAGIASGSIGESDRHRRLKSLTVSGLRTRFADFDVADLGLESVVDVSKGPSLLDERRADAIVRFPEPITNPNRFFGVGVVVEVQHHNDSKDVATVTADYLAAGYSVYWAHETDYTATRFRTERFERAFNERWPNAFAPYFTDADTALQTVERVAFSPEELPSERWSFIDPRPECDHSLHTGHRGSPLCLDCGTTLKQHATGRWMYKPLGER